ncbi:helix-turn-helix transcriptional regulator [Actinomadura luteofluorescens]|uniref:helix-turn-helix transcriptional regulator n=1 Tax=Actinomadura luteofluorescens TaxID=46163 RepID=UPI003D8EAF6B
MTEQSEAPARPLYDRLRRIQLDKGWTNKQLADRAGISRGTIENWKTQPRSPLPSTVKDVAARLGIPYFEALALAGLALVDDEPINPANRFRPPSEHDDRTGETTAGAGGKAVRLTVHVNPEDPEPEFPPGGLRNQSERIIWAMVDEPWQVRLAQILTGREVEASLTAREEKAAGNGE